MAPARSPSCGGHDRHRRPTVAGHHQVGEAPPDLGQQQVGGLDQAAADHDHRRVEHVGEVGEAQRDPARPARRAPPATPRRRPAPTR